RRDMMRTRAAIAGLVAAAFASVLSTGEIGCGSTGSQRFDFVAHAGGIERDATQPFTFTNPTGGEGTLSRANVTMGPIYLNVIAPLRSASFFRFLPQAYADDSHLGDGRVVGEVLGRVTVDALSPTLVPFGVTGSITGEQVRTTDIWFWPPPGTPAETI